MTTDPVVAGVDAGASHSEIVIADADGTERARVRGSAAAVRPGGERASAITIIGLLDEATRQAGTARIASLVVGAAGAGHAAVQTALADHLRALGAPDRTRVVTDAETAYVSALGDTPGILVLSGTGSIAVARDTTGAWHRIGGLGWRFGDEGSGFSLGNAGVRAVAQAAEGRGPPTALTTMLPAGVNAPDVRALIRWAHDAEPREIAALGTAVQRAARNGDGVAAALLDRAAEDLAAHVTALLRYFPAPVAVPTIVGGGAVQPGSPLRASVLEVLAERVPVVAVLDRALDPARGAAILAAR